MQPVSIISLDLVDVRYAMHSPVVTLREQMRLGDVRDVLRRTRHNGFPVVRDAPQVPRGAGEGAGGGCIVVLGGGQGRRLRSMAMAMGAGLGETGSCVAVFKPARSPHHCPHLLTSLLTPIPPVQGGVCVGLIVRDHLLRLLVEAVKRGTCQHLEVRRACPLPALRPACLAACCSCCCFSCCCFLSVSVARPTIPRASSHLTLPLPCPAPPCASPLHPPPSAVAVCRPEPPCTSPPNPRPPQVPYADLNHRTQVDAGALEKETQQQLAVLEVGRGGGKGGVGGMGRWRRRHSSSSSNSNSWRCWRCVGGLGGWGDGGSKGNGEQGGRGGLGRRW